MLHWEFGLGKKGAWKLSSSTPPNLHQEETTVADSAVLSSLRRWTENTQIRYNTSAHEQPSREEGKMMNLFSLNHQ